MNHSESHHSKTDFPKGLDKGLWFVPLGGAGEIGMNLNLYACDDDWLMVDLGVAFGEDSIPGVDLVMPDPSFITERSNKLLGLVLTHAHEDHLGAVAYLWPKLKCPVYATPFAATFLEYKLKSAGLEREVPVKIIPLGSSIEIGPFSIELITLPHSIPESNALAIRTPHGTIFHTGDWKFDPNPLIGKAADYDALQDLGDENILAVVSDSTNVLSEGESNSELDVRDNLTELFAGYIGRIVVGCFASNVARLVSIARAAEINDRHVALVGASLWRIAETARSTGYLSPDLRFYEAAEVAALPRDKVVYICTGSLGESRAALSQIAFGYNRNVDLGKGDVAVFSSRVIPGNEKAISKVQNQLARQGVKVVTARDKLIHVSGHPAREDLRRMYQLTRPRVVIPVHGEEIHMRAHAELAKECQVPHTVIVNNGTAVNFGDDKARIAGTVWSGRLAWDDGVALPFTSSILRERKRMVYGGAAVITVPLDDTGNILDKIQMSIIGFSDPLAENREWNWNSLIVSAVERLPKKGRCEDGAVEEAVRAALRKHLAPKRPIIRVHVVRA